MSEKIISFGVSIQEFNKIQDRAKQENMSIAMYCKSIILPESEFTKYYDYLIDKIKTFPPNITFTIRDIMKDEMWNTIPKGVKLAIGRQFYSQVHSRIIDYIDIVGYGAAKTMRYSKK
jgi:hypothetical protein